MNDPSPKELAATFKNAYAYSGFLTPDRDELLLAAKYMRELDKLRRAKVMDVAAEARAEAAEARLAEAVGVMESGDRMLTTARVLMESTSVWTNPAGYMTDAALWIDTAQTRVAAFLSGNQEVERQLEELRGSRDLSPSAGSSAQRDGG